MKKHEWKQYSEIRHYCPHCENIKFVYDISIPNKWWDAKNHKWTTKEPECIERPEKEAGEHEWEKKDGCITFSECKHCYCMRQDGDLVTDYIYRPLGQPLWQYDEPECITRQTAPETDIGNDK